MLADLTIKDFLAETAVVLPVPGGGNISALNGAIAAALTNGGPSDCWQKEICGSGRTNEDDRYRGGYMIRERLTEYIDKGQRGL